MWLLLALAACDPGAPAKTSPPPPSSPTIDSATPARPENVLVILADDVGTDKIAAYAEHPYPPATPNLDALAAEGVLFRNAWVYDACSPTRAALLTGRYGRRTGVGVAIEPYGPFALADREITIPEMLRGSPSGTWSTSVVGKWHLAGYESADPFANPGVQGFGWYSVAMSNLQDTEDPSTKDEGYYHWEKDENGDVAFEDGYATTVQVDTALARIAAMPSPWFAYVPLSAAHTPFELPPTDLYYSDANTGAPAQIYGAMVEAMDAEIGRLLASVDLTTTTVIFLGDNGTPDQAVQAPWDASKAKLTLYEGGINVPLIVAGPRVAEPGTETAALVDAVDIFPTVAEIAGVDPASLTDEEGAPVATDGRSLLPWLADPTAAGKPWVYTEDFHPLGPLKPRDHDLRAIRGPRYKLLVNDIAGVEQLFDLQGRFDDGDDLLAAGTLDADAAAAYADLSAELQVIRETVVP